MNKTGFVAPTEYSPEEIAAMEKKAAADQAKYLEEMEMRKVHESIKKGDLTSAAKARQPIEGPKLDLETWKKQYPQYLKDTAENMSEDSRSINYIDDLIKKSKNSESLLRNIVGDSSSAIHSKDFSDIVAKNPSIKKGDDLYKAMDKIYGKKLGEGFSDVYSESRWNSLRDSLPADYKTPEEYVEKLKQKGLSSDDEVYDSIKNNYNKKYGYDIKKGNVPSFDEAFNTKNAVEDMAEKLDPSIDEFKKAARMDKLKNLAKGLGKGLAEGAAWGVALDPSEIAPSELPYSQEDMDNLEAEMRMKNAPYNYPTRFEALRKKLGR